MGIVALEVVARRESARGRGRRGRLARDRAVRAEPARGGQPGRRGDGVDRDPARPRRGHRLRSRAHLGDAGRRGDRDRRRDGGVATRSDRRVARSRPRPRRRKWSAISTAIGVAARAGRWPTPRSSSTNGSGPRWSTSGSIEVLDRASSALRWNPRHRGKREAFWPLAVQVRQLLATSRYARSMVWLMVAGAGGDRVPGWSGEATDAFAGALGQLAVGATAVAAGRGSDGGGRPDGGRAPCVRRGGRAPDEPGAALAGDLHGAVRQVLRVLTPATSRRLEGLLRDRYAG